MTHFALPLHATREELIDLASRWADRHGLYVAIERWYPIYGAAAVPLGADLAAAIAQFEPVRRICLRKGVFDVGAINQMQHLVRNPETFVMVLEPLTEDGLRATALTARMGDENALRWWVALVRSELPNLRGGAWAIDPELGGRQYVADHFHTEGARALAREGVPMLAAAGSAVFELDDAG
jgi:2-hydroxychromene-2-carboxylate isomerase